MVAMPYAMTPLHTYEARYRVVFSTVLPAEPGVEEAQQKSKEDRPRDQGVRTRMLQRTSRDGVTPLAL